MFLRPTMSLIDEVGAGACSLPNKHLGAETCCLAEILLAKRAPAHFELGALTLLTTRPFCSTQAAQEDRMISALQEPTMSLVN